MELTNKHNRKSIGRLKQALFFILELSQAVVDVGAVPLLVLCIQEPELDLKRIAASALSDICKHSPEVLLLAACSSCCI